MKLSRDVFFEIADNLMAHGQACLVAQRLTLLGQYLEDCELKSLRLHVALSLTMQTV